MILSVIVAYDEGGVIGKEGAMPWHLPADLARFKTLTMGSPIIMGRRTYESIGRPLPGRTNIVISRQKDLEIESVTVTGSLEEALAAAETTGAAEAFVIGGGMLYVDALPFADKVYGTEVHARYEGDVSFPSLDPSGWQVVEEETIPADERNQHAHTFRVFLRRRDRGAPPKQKQ